MIDFIISLFCETPPSIQQSLYLLSPSPSWVVNANVPGIGDSWDGGMAAQWLSQAHLLTVLKDLLSLCSPLLSSQCPSHFPAELRQATGQKAMLRSSRTGQESGTLQPAARANPFQRVIYQKVFTIWWTVKSMLKLVTSPHLQWHFFMQLWEYAESGHIAKL